jgi:hypothetical protein
MREDVENGIAIVDFIKRDETSAVRADEPWTSNILFCREKTSVLSPPGTRGRSFSFQSMVRTSAGGTDRPPCWKILKASIQAAMEPPGLERNGVSNYVMWV